MDATDCVGSLDFDGADLKKHAVDLLSQQCWCWGQDIMHPDGNWLIACGFERTPPPESRKDCSSLYTLSVNEEYRVILRGFGVFFGKEDLGGIYLPRYEFGPHYNPQPILVSPPWADSDVPSFDAPCEKQKEHCVALVSDLIEWICSYEDDLKAHHGIDYRRETLKTWNNGKRGWFPAEQMVPRWQWLAEQFVLQPADLFRTAQAS